MAFENLIDEYRKRFGILVTLFVINVASAVLLYLDVPYGDGSRLNAEYPVAGFCVLSGVALAIALIILWVKHWRNICSWSNNLNDDERKALKQFIDEGNAGSTFEVEDAAIASLSQRGMIAQERKKAFSMSSRRSLQRLKLCDDAYRYFLSNQELIAEKKTVGTSKG